MSDNTTEIPTPAAESETDPQSGTMPTEPQWITGPSSTTVLAGLLTLVVAVLAGVRLTTDIEVDWSVAVPVTVIALGFVAVVLGVASFSRRSRSAEHESAE